MNIKRGLSDDKNDQGLWLTSNIFLPILVLMKFLFQLITEFPKSTKAYN